MLERFGLQLGQDELRAAHWNPQNNETLELWLEKNVPSPHDCVGICAPRGILQRMATPGTDPGLIPDDCLALVQCDSTNGWPRNGRCPPHSLAGL